MSALPLISVITATWNCADTLPHCLSSVARQDYRNLEHVVVDGASTDGTLLVLEEHRHQTAICISEPDHGIYDALNKGIALASGEVVGFLHADDFYASDDVLSAIAEQFRDPSVCAVYGDLQYVRKTDTTEVVRRWKSNPFQARDLAWGWMPPHPTLYVRKDWYSRIGGFDTRFRISADYLSIRQLFGHPDFKAVYLSKTLVNMRLGGVSNRSLKSIARKTKEDWEVLRHLDLDLRKSAFAVVAKNLGKVGQLFSDKQRWKR